MAEKLQNRKDILNILVGAYIGIIASLITSLWLYFFQKISLDKLDTTSTAGLFIGVSVVLAACLIWMLRYVQRLVNEINELSKHSPT